jgi:hypothetical protein
MVTLHVPANSQINGHTNTQNRQRTQDEDQKQPGHCHSGLGYQKRKRAARLDLHISRVFSASWFQIGSF